MKTLINRQTFLSIAMGLTLLAAQVAQGSFASINLGPAADYSVLGLSGPSGHGSTIHLSSGPLRVNGNVGVGDFGALNFDGGGQINGRVDASSSAALNNTANATPSILKTSNNRGPRLGSRAMPKTHSTTHAPNVSAAPKPDKVQEATPKGYINTMLTGNGGLNVISIGQDIHLSGGNLTLTGNASDVFVFKIAGTMELSGNTNIVLNGGLTAGNVIWDFIGSGSQFQTSGQSQTAGIFLAPERVININGGVHNSEFISGMSLSFQSNPLIIPEASTTALLILGAVIATGIAMRRRRSRAI